MTGETPHTVLRPPSRWAALNIGEIWAFRDLLARLTIRDLKLRYKQTALGVVWVVLQPILAAGILAFVFGRVAGLTSEGVPYFCFAYVSMACWNLFSQTLTKSASSLVGNSALVAKIFFPRLILPLSTVGSTLVDFAVTFAMGAVVVAASGITPGIEILLLPAWVIGLSCTTQRVLLGTASSE